MIEKYRALEEKLRASRNQYPPGSPEEEPILEEMEILWWNLSEQERDQLDSEGSNCWPDKNPTL